VEGVGKTKKEKGKEKATEGLRKGRGLDYLGAWKTVKKSETHGR